MLGIETQANDKRRDARDDLRVEEKFQKGREKFQGEDGLTKVIGPKFFQEPRFMLHAAGFHLV